MSSFYQPGFLNLDYLNQGNKVLPLLCGYESGAVEANTRAMIGAIRNPLVQIICHPGNPSFPVDIEKVVLAAKLSGKALEINNSPFYMILQHKKFLQKTS